jgi:hypothetical protein
MVHKKNLFRQSRIFIIAVAIICSLDVPAEPDLLFNGNFESNASGWKLPAKQWRVEKGIGLGKSAALVFEVKNDTKRNGISWAETDKSARFSVEGGMGYRFEGWFKSDKLRIRKGRDLGLYFAAYDNKGKVVKECEALPVIDNAVNAIGWCKVSGEISPLPPEAAKGGLYFWSGPCVGKAYIDGLSVRPVIANPVDKLVVSAYRSEAWTGDVSFAAAYCVNPYKNPVSNLVATLEYMSPTGKVSASCMLKDNVAAITLPVESFSFGKNKVTLVLCQKGGNELGRSDCFFCRESEPMRRKVTFDERHRTLINGKPYFPLGMYWHWNEVTPENLTKYKEGPFNCLVGYGAQDEDKMDLCHSYGVNVIASANGFFKDISKAKTPQKAAEIEARYIRGRVRRFWRHPAVIAWYLADEVPSVYAGVLARKRDIVHEIDPDHPTWICHDKPAEIRELINGFDVIGVDPYPIGNRGGKDRTAISRATSWARQAIKQTYGFRPLWQVPQAFDWGYWRPNETNRVDVRMPTYAEFRSMTWQAIAAGATGLIYYSFYDLLLHHNWPKERTAGAWENICAVANEVKAFEPVFFSNDPEPVVVGEDDNVAARAWKYKGEIHVLLVNTLRKNVQGTIKINNHSIQYNLNPIEVKFLKIKDSVGF